MKITHSKKMILPVLVFIILLLSGPALAIDIFLDGEKLKLDTQSRVKHSLVFVPLRGIFEKMGAVVHFEKETRKITAVKGKKIIVLVLDNPIAKINGSPRRMFQPPFEKKGRTLVPLRFLSESLGCRVSWHPPTKTVAISTDPAKDPFQGLDLDQQRKDTEWGKEIKPDIKGIDKIKPIEKNGEINESKESADPTGDITIE